MKINCEMEQNFLINKLSRIPMIESCECISELKNEFRLLIQFKNEMEKTILVRVYDVVTPLTIKKASAEMRKMTKGRYAMIMAPYISEKSEQVCIDNGIGYADLSGNILFSLDFVYISEKGNLNKYPKKRKSGNIFYASSAKTLRILRTMLEETNRTWKITELATEAECSVGMVSRVKEKLCEQLWAEMTPDGLKLVDPKGLLDAWAQEYQKSSSKMVACYTLDTLPKFEQKIKEIHDAYGLDSCLTGLSGGTRYTPVVRYNRVHVLVNRADMDKFIEYAGCKRVESGANVILIEAQEDQMMGSRTIKGNVVASPVQIFLDCSKIKGRGEEMAIAVFEKEIKK